MFRLAFSEVAARVLDELEQDNNYEKKLRKVRKALGQLEQNPRHPGLNSHQYTSLEGPGGEKVWESYVENRTPQAWRIWWWYGPDEGVITILTIGPHPD